MDNNHIIFSKDSPIHLFISFNNKHSESTSIASANHNGLVCRDAICILLLAVITSLTAQSSKVSFNLQPMYEISFLFQMKYRMLCRSTRSTQDGICYNMIWFIWAWWYRILGTVIRYFRLFIKNIKGIMKHEIHCQRFKNKIYLLLQRIIEIKLTKHDGEREKEIYKLNDSLVWLFFLNPKI